MSMTTGGGGGQSANINVTPLIDVLLVLLIIFMVITPLTPKAWKRWCPAAASQPEAGQHSGPHYRSTAPGSRPGTCLA